MLLWSWFPFVSSLSSSYLCVLLSVSCGRQPFLHVLLPTYMVCLVTFVPASIVHLVSTVSHVSMFVYLSINVKFIYLIPGLCVLLTSSFDNPLSCVCQFCSAVFPKCAKSPPLYITSASPSVFCFVLLYGVRASIHLFAS